MSNTTVTRPPTHRVTADLQAGDFVWWPSRPETTATVASATRCGAATLRTDGTECWLVASTDGRYVHTGHDHAWRLATPGERMGFEEPDLDATPTDLLPYVVAYLEAVVDGLAEKVAAIALIDERLALLEERVEDLARAAAAADVARSLPVTPRAVAS